MVGSTENVADKSVINLEIILNKVWKLETGAYNLTTTWEFKCIKLHSLFLFREYYILLGAS